jgi:heat shock protein HslJ
VFRRRWAVLLLAASAAASCSSNPAVDGVALDGTSWVAVTIAGQPPVAGHEPNLTFRGGTITGWLGCNGFGARRVDISDSALTVHELGGTAMACSGPGDPDPLTSPIMQTEQAFVRALAGADRIAVSDDTLVISGPGGEITLRRLQPGESLGHL